MVSHDQLTTEQKGNVKENASLKGTYDLSTFAVYGQSFRPTLS